MTTDPRPTAPRVFGRYAIFDKIASGGMASVHFGRLMGPAGFSRTVAIKKLHDEYARDAEFVAAFLDEAKLAARIRHLNVVPTLDVVAVEDEVLLVMEYVQGEALSRILKRLSAKNQNMPHRIVASVLSGALQGLHAAHEATDERGRPLGLVHRDVSPHNILLGADGLARVVDFGVAKAEGRASVTKEARIKGKLSYMAPEQIATGVVSQSCDIYSASVVLWEALTGRNLFQSDNSSTTIGRIVAGEVPLPSSLVRDLPRAYDDVVMRGINRDPAKRYGSALEMALDLERCDGIESPVGVAGWLKNVVGQQLSERAERVAAIERDSEVSGVEEIRRIAANVASVSRPNVLSGAPVSGSLPTGAAASPSSIVSWVKKPTSRPILAVAASLVVLVVVLGVVALVVARRSAERRQTGDVEGIGQVSSNVATPVQVPAPTAPAPSVTETEPSVVAIPPASGSAEVEPLAKPAVHTTPRHTNTKGKKPGSLYDPLGGRR